MKKGSRFFKKKYILLAAFMVLAAFMFLLHETKPWSRIASNPVPRSLYQQEINDQDIDWYLTRIGQTLAAGERASNLYGGTEDFRQMLARMHLTPETVLADIGAGTGLLELTILENDLPCRLVYAVDIDRRAVEFLTKVLEMSSFSAKARIHPVLSTMTDVSLPSNEVDIAAIISTTAFDGRIDPQGRLTVDGKGQACLASLRRALKPEGMIHYFNKLDTEKEPTGELARSAYAFEQAGFSLMREEIFTPKEEAYIHLVFRR